MSEAKHVFSKYDQQTIEDAARLLSPSTSLLFITGAGISADSGVPTYRGVGGLYNDGKTTDEGMPIETALSGPVFQRQPEITWKALKQIANATRGVQPNRGHQVIAEIESQFERVWTLTQNIDGLHRRAGTKNLIDIHGDMSRIKCTACDWRTTVSSPDEIPGWNDPIPRCPKCQNVIRPEVVLFQETLPDEKFIQLQTELKRGFDAVIIIGTSAVFRYITLPVEQARQRGAYALEINPVKSEVSDIVSFRIAAGAAVTLDAIWSKYQEQPRRSRSR